MFSAWLRSCLSCLWSQVDLEREGHGQAVQKKAVEREMQVCHSQPHLVPPMKLVFYDTLPSPGPRSQSKSLLPPWMHETKSLASRASQRASILVRRQPPKRPTISAPTDFRRTDLPRGRVPSFRPLELSIYLPGNRLSDLPEFSSFDLNSAGEPSPPAKALVSPFDSAGHLRRQSGPFQLARKPIGSPPSRRGSMATLEQQLQQAQSRQSTDIASANPLVPHFSVVSPVSSRSAGPSRQFRALRPISEPFPSSSQSPTKHRPNKSLPGGSIAVGSLPSPSFPLASTPPRHSLESHPSYNARKATGRKKQGQSSRSSSLTSMSTITNTNTNTTKSQQHTPTKSSSTLHNHSRVRTISNSTISSKTPSLSSAITAATTIFPSDKELESAFGTLPVIPASAKTSMVAQGPEVDDEDQIHPGGYEYDQRFPTNAVGLAF